MHSTDITFYIFISQLNIFTDMLYIYIVLSHETVLDVAC